MAGANRLASPHVRTLLVGVTLAVSIALAASPSATVAASAATKRSPDTITVRDPDASFVDVHARREQLKNAQNPRLTAAMAEHYSCITRGWPQPPKGWIIIPPLSSPDRQALAAPYSQLKDALAYGANRYLESGDPQKRRACWTR